MTDYDELVKALRYCAESGDFNCNKDCPMYPNYPRCLTKMDMDAADAIEELQAEVKDAFNRGYNAGYTAGIGYMSFKREKELKRGEWINYKDEHQCSVCRNVVCDEWYDDEQYDYCPYCGAKMEVQDGQ